MQTTNNTTTAATATAAAASILTHSGVFHADEVLACAALQMAFGPLPVRRTRDRRIVESAQADPACWVLDLGGAYDPAARNFDHHQVGGLPTFEWRPEGLRVPATAGLVWLQVGHQIAGEAAQAVDLDLVAQVDARDNGVEGVESPLSAIVAGINPTWQQEGQAAEDAAFEQAVAIATVVLQNTIRSAQGKIAARDLVLGSERLFEGRVALLERFAPWQEALVETDVEYVVFPAKGSGWNIQAVPKALKGFATKRPLPEAWAAAGDDLPHVTGVADATFCHKGRFIAGAKSRNGILALAALALA